MGDTRYIGPYVLAKKDEDWEDKYAYGETDGLGLKKMRCFSYGSIPLFVPDYARDEDSFEDFGTEIGGGTFVFDVDEETIKNDISKMTKECNADLKRLKKIFGSLSIKWGMVTQYG